MSEFEITVIEEAVTLETIGADEGCSSSSSSTSLDIVDIDFE